MTVVYSLSNTLQLMYANTPQSMTAHSKILSSIIQQQNIHKSQSKWQIWPTRQIDWRKELFSYTQCMFRLSTRPSGTFVPHYWQIWEELDTSSPDTQTPRWKTKSDMSVTKTDSEVCRWPVSLLCTWMCAVCWHAVQGTQFHRPLPGGTTICTELRDVSNQHCTTKQCDFRWQKRKWWKTRK